MTAEAKYLWIILHLYGAIGVISYSYEKNVYPELFFFLHENFSCTEHR